MKKLKISLVVVCSIASFILPSCNVTRVVSTEAQSFNRGDTCVHIVTRTVETYDASKKTF